MEKKSILILIIFSIGVLMALQAEDVSLPEILFERTLLSFSGNLTLAEDFDGIGAGLTLGKLLTFLDGRNMNGTYLMIFFSGPIRLLHPDNVQIDDTKLIGFGYRGNTFIRNLGFDANISIIRGSRRIDNTVYGDNYFGIYPEVGLYFPHESFIDFGLSIGSGINLFALASDTEIPNVNYFDISFIVTIKNFYKKQAYPWHEN